MSKVMARFLTMDKSDLEEFANDLLEIQDRITSILEHPPEGKAKFLFEEIRYMLASWTIPICCVCGNKPTRWINEAYYCEGCVKYDR